MAETQGEGIVGTLKRAALTAIGVALGSYWLDGIHYDSYETLAWVVLSLVVLSAILRPILVVLALPFVVLTLGLGLLVINAFLYLIAARLVTGFDVDGFWYAFGGAFIISILHGFFSNWINGGRNRPRVRVQRSGAAGSKKRRVKADEDVIDI